MVRGIPVFARLFLIGGFIALPVFSYAKGERTEVMSRVLGSMPLFEGLSDQEIRKVEEICRLKEYPSNTRLIERGQGIDRLYLIITGRGEVRLTDRTIPFGKHFLLGEVEFVDPVPAVAEVVLITGCMVIEIDYKALDGFFQSRPDVGLRVMRNLARALSRKIQGMSQ